MDIPDIPEITEIPQDALRHRPPIPAPPRENPLRFVAANAG